jgi:hypothetical protein
MHNILKSILALGSVAMVHATPVTFTDIVNPNDVHMSFLNSSHTFTHSILDNGFVSGTDAIQSATLVLSLEDDFDLFGGNETVRITLDNVVVNNSLEVGNANYSFLVNSSMLQADGQLTVTLSLLSGDFYFNQSRLDVSANRTEAVPEPGTMALMGLGLAGIGFAARRRKA